MWAKGAMDYISLDSFPHYTECARLVFSLGYQLVELKISPQHGTTHILAVIAAKDSSSVIGVDDCSKVHHALLPLLEELLGTDDTSMELTSPGMERNIRNAAEFPLFIGRGLRVWDRTVSDWVCGTLVAADTQSLTLECTQTVDAGGDIAVPRRIVLYADIAKAKFIHL